jgi:hypothetical protein
MPKLIEAHLFSSVCLKKRHIQISVNQSKLIPQRMLYYALSIIALGT